MSSRRTSILALGSVLTLGVGFALMDWRMASAERVSLAAATRAADVVERRIAQQQDRLQAIKAGSAGRRAELSSGPKPAERKRPAIGATDDPRTRDLVANNSKLRDLWMSAFKANLVERFGRLYGKMGLTPEQIETFEELATASADDQRTVYAAGHAQGMTSNDPNLQGYHQQTMQEYYATLGREISPEFSQAVQQTDEDSNREGQFSLVVANANRVTMPVDTTPLTFDQIDQLTQLAERNSPEYTAGGTLDLNTVDWKAFDAQASTFLTPDQFHGVQAAVQQNQVKALLRQFQSQSPQPK